MDDLKTLVVAHARKCGFDLVGITSADDFAADRAAALERLRDGRMEGLPWYTESRVMRGTSPSELLPGARSVICLGLSYLGKDCSDDGRPSTSSGRIRTEAGLTDRDSRRRGLDSRFRGNDGKASSGVRVCGNDGGLHGNGDDGTGASLVVRTCGNDGEAASADGNLPAHPELVEGRAGAGRVARYARVRDYHRVMKRRMRELVRELQRELGSTISARWYVDDGPMLDRAAANRAGIGWFGKNTNILTPGFGSWVFLGQVITDLELEPDAPLKKSCGSCVRCIDDCPTGAIVAPYVIDNARCISYLTIENRGPIPRQLRPLMGDWVFGCDICQDVCPVNRKAQPAGEPIPPPNAAGAVGRSSTPESPGGPVFLDLVELLEISEEDFRSRFAGTSIMRAKWLGMQRNACVALGNLGEESSVPALSKALREAHPLVRGHAAWALGRIGGPQAAAVLADAAATETDPDVAEEIATARRELPGSRGSLV